MIPYQFCLVGKNTIGKKFTLIFQSFVLAVKNSYQKIPSIPVRLYNETFYKFSCHFFCNQTSGFNGLSSSKIDFSPKIIILPSHGSYE